MADTPGFPDTNCCMIIDQQDRLWPIILANTWKIAITNYAISTAHMQPAEPPRWNSQQILHTKPGPDFKARVTRSANKYLESLEISPALVPMVDQWKMHIFDQAGDKLPRRLGWFTRAHPFLLSDGNMLVELYSDGFSFSLVALTKDGGESWRFSDPIVGDGNIQPSFAQQKNGHLLTYMRDNGPPPKRVQVSESADSGLTWSTVYDHPHLPNPGAGLELSSLSDGDWICVYNDTEQGRHRLAVSISTDEGANWNITRHLERPEPGQREFHYPSILQASDGTLHVSYSYFVPTPEGERKSIRHATFNKVWILQGDQ